MSFGDFACMLEGTQATEDEHGYLAAKFLELHFGLQVCVAWLQHIHSYRASAPNNRIATHTWQSTMVTHQHNTSFVWNQCCLFAWVTEGYGPNIFSDHTWSADQKMNGALLHMFVRRGVKQFLSRQETPNSAWVFGCQVRVRISASKSCSTTSPECFCQDYCNSSL